MYTFPRFWRNQFIVASYRKDASPSRTVLQSIILSRRVPSLQGYNTSSEAVIINKSFHWKLGTLSASIQLVWFGLVLIQKDHRGHRSTHNKRFEPQSAVTDSLFLRVFWKASLYTWFRQELTTNGGIKFLTSICLKNCKCSWEKSRTFVEFVCLFFVFFFFLLLRF